MIATNERVPDRTPALQVTLQTDESDAQHRCRFATDAIVSVAGSETSRLRCLSENGNVGVGCHQLPHFKHIHFHHEKSARTWES